MMQQHLTDEKAVENVQKNKYEGGVNFHVKH